MELFMLPLIMTHGIHYVFYPNEVVLIGTSQVQFSPRPQTDHCIVGRVCLSFQSGTCGSMTPPSRILYLPLKS